MNQTLENILGRRSVRAFEDKPIPAEIIGQLISAGNAAPSGGNGQPWRFVVIKNKECREQFAKLALPLYKAWLEKSPASMKEMRKSIDSSTDDPVYYRAPAIVFVIGKGPTADMDCSLACENMMVAARSFEIGSCWVYFGQLIIEVPEIRQLLELAEGEKVYGPMVFGYPLGGFPKSPPKKEPIVTYF
ncbi:nitroreductase family protein [Candidatus Saganbacteria bacterium]|nr:nitroreductase family protein [Candidatus Saganbacteria bacterium]